MQVAESPAQNIDIDKVVLEKTKYVFDKGFTYAPLLYLSFGLMDWFYSPQLWPIFIGLRWVHLFFVLGLKRWLRNQKKLNLTLFQNAGIVWSLVAGSLINIMIFLSEGITSPYYAGLNLVAVLAIFFIPFNLRALFTAVFLVYAPYVLTALVTINEANAITFLLNLGFILSSVFVSITVRAQSHQALIQETQAKNLLALELQNRERIIQERTSENIRLKELSSQFSPQVVKAIQNDHTLLSKDAKSEQITAIFVDVVNSTHKITSLPIEKAQKAISLFTEDCVQTFLKYDLTLDKFLGDGFLAFCNAPLKYPNHADRAVHAAYDLLEKIRMREFEYQRLWESPFEIRIGIASGEALVGFYGSDKGFKSYTGLGVVMNLASRICSQVAQPNSIFLSENTVLLLTQKHFNLMFEGSYQLKGFENLRIPCFKLNGLGAENYAKMSYLHNRTNICSQCSSEQLFLAQNSQGFYVFQCRSCGALQYESLKNAS
jgi:class 3 adenylate cyclase